MLLFDHLWPHVARPADEWEAALHCRFRVAAQTGWVLHLGRTDPRDAGGPAGGDFAGLAVTRTDKTPPADVFWAEWDVGPAGEAVRVGALTWAVEAGEAATLLARTTRPAQAPAYRALVAGLRHPRTYRSFVARDARPAGWSTVTPLHADPDLVLWVVSNGGWGLAAVQGRFAGCARPFGLPQVSALADDDRNPVLLPWGMFAAFGAVNDRGGRWERFAGPAGGGRRRYLPTAREGPP